MDITDIIVLAIGLFSVLTNGILLVILYLDPLKKFRTSTNYLIISLTTSDFLTGAAACLFSFEKPTPKILFMFIWSTVLSSFLTIFVMSCERLIIVLYPLQAKSLITNYRIFASIGVTWLVSTILGGLVGGLPHPEKHYVEFFSFIGILTLVLILVAFYFVIIWRMKSKHELGRDATCSRGQRIIQQDRRLTKVLLLLVTILLVTVVPYVAVTMVISAYNGFSHNKNIPRGLIAFSTSYFPVELLNFAVNPIIYAWHLPNYRKSLVYYLAKCPITSKKLNPRPELTLVPSLPATASQHGETF